MTEDDFKKALKLFGYTEAWVASGAITAELLERQIESKASDELERERDEYEHFRFGALRDFLTVHKEFSDEQFDGLMRIAADERRSTRSDALRNVVYFELLSHSGLTERQFDTVSGVLEEEAFQSQVRRHRLLRGLRQNDRATEFVERCVREGDSVVHRCLLDQDCMDQRQLTWLAQNATKEIRRLAQNRLLLVDSLNPALITWLIEKGVNKDIIKGARRKQNRVTRD